MRHVLFVPSIPHLEEKKSEAEPKGARKSRLAIKPTKVLESSSTSLVHIVVVSHLQKPVCHKPPGKRHGTALQANVQRDGTGIHFTQRIGTAAPLKHDWVASTSQTSVRQVTSFGPTVIFKSARPPLHPVRYPDRPTSTSAFQTRKAKVKQSK